MSDIFKEVDEDIRRDQMKQIWDRIGPFVMGAAVIIVVITAGYRGYEYWQQTRAEASGDQFLAAIETADGGDHAAAIEELQALAAEGSGDYPTLAGFRIASEKAALGDDDGAVAEFDAIAAARSDEVGNMARLRAALILMDSLDAEQLEERIGDLAETGNPWRHIAREMLGLAAWRSGNYETARTYFETIIDDEEGPRDLKQRANVLLALIKSRTGVAETPADSG